MKRIFSLIESEKCRLAVGGSAFLLAFLFRLLSLPTVGAGLFVFTLIFVGMPVFVSAFRGILRGDLLDEKFLMSLAAVGSVILGALADQPETTFEEFAEGAAVMLFYLVGEMFEGYAVAKSRRSIKALMDICPDEACILENGEEVHVDAEDVAVGATLIIRPGERVPVDCRVLEGTADVNTAALTGEALPRSAAPGAELESGTVVLNGVLTCSCLRTAECSSAARVLELVENANERKSRTEAFITKFSHYYTPAVVAVAVLVAALPPLFGVSLRVSLMRGLTCLVVSCPCALLISVPLSFFGGIGAAASRGILFKGGSTFAPLASAEVFAFDKTGTLTTGAFSVSDVLPAIGSADELLFDAASAEYGSEHPIALALRSSCKIAEKSTNVEEIPGQGILATVNGSRVAVGNLLLMEKVGASVGDLPAVKSGVLFVAKDGVYRGAILLSDEVKPEAAEAISTLRALGVGKTVMLSGDRKENAERVGSALALDDVRAELLPDEKYAALEALIGDAKRSVVYVGDGINDAPSLARADVGVAMGGIGSDSAIEAADLVIMSDHLKKLPEAIAIARKTLRISRENIIFAIGIKVAVLALSAFGLFGESLTMFLAIFADVGVAVLAILNAMRALSFRTKGE